MNRIAVIGSSNIKSVGHDQLAHTLEIEFINGKVWQYFNFPAEKFVEFMNAESKGKYFDQEIRNQYDSKSVFSPQNRMGLDVRISWDEDQRRNKQVEFTKETVERALRGLMGQTYTELSITIR